MVVEKLPSKRKRKMKILNLAAEAKRAKANAAKLAKQDLMARKAYQSWALASRAVLRLEPRLLERGFLEEDPEEDPNSIGIESRELAPEILTALAKELSLFDNAPSGVRFSTWRKGAAQHVSAK